MERPAKRDLGRPWRVLGVALIPEVAAGVFSGFFGLLIGSFLNVVIWRVPRGESLISPGSACPSCGTPIRPRDNVPIISWALLRGKCRSCKGRIAIRYPLVEAATAAAFVGVTLLFRDDPWAWPAWGYFAAICIALTLIDIDVMRLPSAIILPSYVVGAALLSLAIALGDSGLADGGRAALGMAGLWGLYALLATVKKGGMGWGDVRLAGVLGGYLGWVGVGALVVGGFSAFLLGGVWAIGVMAFGGGTRKSRIPFGPWMMLGAVAGAVWGESIWQAYLSLVL